jgi:hypothetical protein
VMPNDELGHDLAYCARHRYRTDQIMAGLGLGFTLSRELP